MWGNNFHLLELQRAEGSIHCCCANCWAKRSFFTPRKALLLYPLRKGACVSSLDCNTHPMNWDVEGSVLSNKLSQSGWKRDNHIGWAREILCWQTPSFPQMAKLEDAGKHGVGCPFQGMARGLRITGFIYLAGIFTLISCRSFWHLTSFSNPPVTSHISYYLFCCGFFFFFF